MRELDRVLRRNQGIPWVNTIAADSRGEAYYADISVVPHVTDQQAERCNTSVGRGTFSTLRVAVLDGSRSDCEWGRDADAVQPGTFGPGRMPHLFRRDYVTNSNDSYWLSNPRQPLEGFDLMIGDEGTARSLRTRVGLLMAQGRRFSLRELQRTAQENRVYSGELFRDDLVGMCETSGPEVADACPVLRAWNLRDDLDSRGAVLFRRFATRVLVNAASAAVPPPGVFRVPFDDAVGRRISDLGLTPAAVLTLTDEHSATDHVLDTSARIVVLNRMPVITHDRVIGSVVTLRDRTELWGLRQELDTTRHTADALRAQTHEFSNRLHTIAGLLRLGKVERAQRYVTEVQTGHNQFLNSVTSRIDDQTLAALVVAKGSMASERGVELVIADDTRVGILPLDLAATLETVIGNFVDNALDACAGVGKRHVVLTIIGDPEQIVVEVRDNGPGIEPSLMPTIFDRGVSTKTTEGTRGIGLALARAVCEQRGGHVEVHNDDGAVFTAVIPRAQRAQRNLSSQR